MPWSPIPKFPILVKKLQGRGLKFKCGFNDLKRVIMEELHLISSKSIKQTIQAMITLGFLRLRQDQLTYDIMQKDPFIFVEDDDLGKYDIKK